MLYERRGFSLRTVMPTVLDLAARGYNAAYYRSAHAVVNFATNYAPGALRSGSDPNYRIGAMVFTSLAPIQSNIYGTYNHVAIVVRGTNANMTFEQALDYVLVAQVSYSSQGYFESAFDSQALPLSPDNGVGRYEVISLRTYLIKHLLRVPLATASNVENIGFLTNAAARYLSHWAPPEL